MTTTKHRARITLPDGRSASLGVFATWDEADGVARAAVEELGEASGAVGTVETVEATTAAREGLLSAKEAAALLGVSLSTFKETVKAQLPSVRIGARVLFKRKDVEAWSDAHTEAGSSDSRAVAGAPRGSFASATMGNGSNAARVEQIKARLQSKPRASTRTS